MVSALPCTNFTWNVTPITVVWGGERGPGKHTDKDIFSYLQEYPLCGRRSYCSKEGSLSGYSFVCHWEFSLKQTFFKIVSLLNAQFCSVFAWSFSICFLGGLLKTKPVLGEVGCVCVSRLAVYEWFCLLFGCVFLQRCGTLISNCVCVF